VADDLVIEAIEAARTTRGSLAGAILHSDRASQYLSRKVRNLLATLGVPQSAGRVATRDDNVVAEPFLATLKRELVHNQRFGGLGEPRRAIDAWIRHYNTVRLQSARGDSNLLQQREGLNSRPLTLKVADDATMVAVLRVGPNFVKQAFENSLVWRVAICEGPHVIPPNGFVLGRRHAFLKLTLNGTIEVALCHLLKFITHCHCLLLSSFLADSRMTTAVAPASIHTSWPPLAYHRRRGFSTSSASGGSPGGELVPGSVPELRSVVSSWACARGCAIDSCER